MQQAGDTCTWTGSPVATTSGIERAVGTVAPTSTKPWFSTSVTSQMTGRGRVRLRIHVGIRLVAVGVVALQDSRRVTLRVRRLSHHWYSAAGRLPAGTWTVRIRYYTTRTSRRRPTSQMQVTVP